MLLTARDEEMLVCLTWKGRALAADLLAGTWWDVTRSGRLEARRRARNLIEAGLLRELTAIVRPLPPLCEPVIAWQPQ